MIPFEFDWFQVRWILERVIMELSCDCFENWKKGRDGSQMNLY